MKAIFLASLLLVAGSLGILFQGKVISGIADPETRLRRGTRLLEEGLFEDGEQHLRLALASSRVEVLKVAHHNMGVASLEMARRTDGLRARQWAEAAVFHAEAALRTDPSLEGAAWNLELALMRLDELNGGDAAGRAERARRLLASFRLEEEDRLAEVLKDTIAKTGGGTSAERGGGPWW